MKNFWENCCNPLDKSGLLWYNGYEIKAEEGEEVEYTGGKTDISGWVMAEHGAPQSKWKVIEFDHYELAKDGRHKREYWVAECTCEKHTRRVIERYGLLLGIYKDCGCSKKCNNIEGQRFGKLIAVKNLGKKKLPNKPHGRTVYLCKCDCGNEVEVVANDLIFGNVCSCGCELHRARQENGKKRHKVNRYDLTGEYGIGYASNTGNPFYFDIEDYDKIKDYCWLEYTHKAKKEGNREYHCLTTTVYPSGGKRKTLLMTTVIGRFRYDHINRNPMDNRKENLRPATARQNVLNTSLKRNNTSGFTGVYFTKKDGKWHATVKIDINGKKKVIVRQFDNKEEAIKCRLKMERDYYGEFAPQRHLFAQYGIEETPREEEEK